MYSFPYLSFAGKAEEALKFYQEATGGDIEVMYYKDMPADASMPSLPEHAKNYVTNGCLSKNGTQILMVSDDFEEPVNGNSVSVNLMVESLEDAEKAYSVLSQGAKVIMPLAEVFWAERYALFVDKFGISFMINYFGCKKDKFKDVKSST